MDGARQSSVRADNRGTRRRPSARTTAEAHSSHPIPSAARELAPPHPPPRLAPRLRPQAAPLSIGVPPPSDLTPMGVGKSEGRAAAEGGLRPPRASGSTRRRVPPRRVSPPARWGLGRSSSFRPARSPPHPSSLFPRAREKRRREVLLSPRLSLEGKDVGWKWGASLPRAPPVAVRPHRREF